MVETREKLFDVDVTGTGDFDADKQGCSTCKHIDDTEEICKLRRCIHAFYRMTDCYVRENKENEAE
jgi:hypothetical protein